MKPSQLKERARLEKAAELTRSQWERDFRAVMSTPEGQRFFFSMLDRLNVWGPSYREGATATAYEEGRRAVGIEWMADALRVCPADYVHAYQQALSSQRDEELRRQAADARTVNGNGDANTD